MKKKIRYLFLILCALNIAVFVFRDSFQYKPFASYADLYGRCSESCIASWKGSAARYSQEEREQGRRILDSMVQKNSRTTVAIATDIASFLYRQFHAQIGLPDSIMQIAAPLEQYRQLSRNPGRQLWCGNFGTMFFYFCWMADIPCRAIEIVADGDHHIVNEFFDEQTGRWVFADAMSDLCAIKDERGNYLNLVDFIKAVDGPGKRNGLLTGTEGKQVSSTYYRNSSILYFFHDFDKEKVYSLPEKLLRYFLPVSWYEVYTTEPGSNSLFYAKLTLFVCWLLCLVLFLTMPAESRRNTLQQLAE